MKIKIIVVLFILVGLGASVIWLKQSGKASLSPVKQATDSTAEDIAAIRAFMADPNLELSFVNTDLPMPYFRVGKVTKTSDGENMKAVESWVRQINVYENAKPLSDGSCGVYQYHIDPRSHTLTSVVTRGLKPNEIKILEEKGTPCRDSNQMPKISKTEAEKTALGYLERALPNFSQIKKQFVYTQKLGGESHDWIWEDKDYKLPDDLSGRPYSYPVIRMTVFGNGSIIYHNTVSLFEN